MVSEVIQNSIMLKGLICETYIIITIIVTITRII